MKKIDKKSDIKSEKLRNLKEAEFDTFELGSAEVAVCKNPKQGSYCITSGELTDEQYDEISAYEKERGRYGSNN